MAQTLDQTLDQDRVLVYQLKVEPMGVKVDYKSYQDLPKLVEDDGKRLTINEEQKVVPTLMDFTIKKHGDTPLLDNPPRRTLDPMYRYANPTISAD